jgi:trehalose-6-phosphate synthase
MIIVAFTLLVCTQIFRALAHGELLLQGMLSANIVGFHAFDHARHFLNAGKRLLGLSYQSIKVSTQNRSQSCAAVAVYHE